MPTKGRLEVLREPGFRRLFLGRTTSLVGDGMSPVAIAICLGAVYAVPSVRRLEVRVDEPNPTPPPRPIEAGD